MTIQELIEKYNNKLEKTSDYNNIPWVLINWFIDDLKELKKTIQPYDCPECWYTDLV